MNITLQDLFSKISAKCWCFLGFGARLSRLAKILLMFSKLSAAAQWILLMLNQRSVAPPFILRHPPGDVTPADHHIPPPWVTRSTRPTNITTTQRLRKHTKRHCSHNMKIATQTDAADTPPTPRRNARRGEQHAADAADARLN